MTDHLDTGYRINAAPSTAAFVRDQLARGVSAETLRRRLGIRPQHMFDLLAGGDPTPPLPRPVLATRRDVAPVPVKPTAPVRKPVDRAGYALLQRARAKEHQAEAEALAARILPVVGSLFSIPWTWLIQPGGGKGASVPRAMVYGLMAEMRPNLQQTAMGKAMSRKPTSAHEGLLQCTTLRKLDREFADKFRRALDQLRAEP